MISIMFSLLLVPLFSAILIFLIPNSRKETFRPIGIAFSLITLTQCVYLLFGEYAKTEFTILSTFQWIQSYGINLHFGLSGISTLLLLLSSLLVFVSLLSIGKDHSESKGFVGSLLMLHFAINGVFISGDLISLFIFFEALLIPMYFLMGIWGGENRRYATIKFILYTVFGSVFIFIGTVYTAVLSFGVNGRLAVDFETLSSLSLLESQSKTLFLLFTFGFLIKVPIFPLHTWLPDAHVEAPTAGSIMLAGVLLKVGAYGVFRVSIPFFTEGFLAYKNLIAILSVIGIIYERRHTRKISDFGGIKISMPRYAAIFLFTSFASIGLPGLNGFVGEFMILMGSYNSYKILTSFAAFGVVLAAIYMLWAYQRMFTGPIKYEENKNLSDLNSRETASVLPLLLLMLFIGVYPSYIESFVIKEAVILSDTIALFMELK